jgi:hypothetical protein
MPRIGERWERGTWASKKLRGDVDGKIEAGHTDEEERLGGMAGLGLRVIESQSPTTKIVENRFNFLQRIMATIPGQIGRKRGEFEGATKLWMECREGRRDPREHFLPMSELADRIEQSLHYVNSESVEGYVYSGVPAALWAEGIAAAPLKKLGPEQGYLFSRDRRSITASKGHVMVRFTRDDGTRGAHFFHHPELWKFDGEKMGVFFDGYVPSAGATLVCESGRRRGTVVGRAEYVEGAPQFSLAAGMAGRGGEDGYERRRGWTNAVIGEVRNLGLSNTLSRSRIADNGEGGRVEISKASSGCRGAQGDPATGPHIPVESQADGPSSPGISGEEENFTPKPRSGGLASVLFDGDQQ